MWLREAAGALRRVDGRKQILYFSEGFDSRLLLGRQTTDEETETDNSNIAFGQLWMVDNDASFGNTSLQRNLERMREQVQNVE